MRLRMRLVMGGKERLDRGGVSVLLSKSPEEFSAFMRGQSERWGAVVREANIIAD